MKTLYSKFTLLTFLVITVLLFSSCGPDKPEIKLNIVTSLDEGPQLTAPPSTHGFTCEGAGTGCVEKGSSLLSIPQNEYDNEVQNFKQIVMNGGIKNYFTNSQQFKILFSELGTVYNDVRLKIIDGTYKVEFNSNNVVLIYERDLSIRSNIIHAFQL